MVKSTFMRTTLLILIILVIPQAIMARGAMDQGEKFEEELQEITEEICFALEAKEMTATQAKSTLSELRARFQKEYTDESGRMDAIIDAVANGEMTAEQAREGFMVLQQDRIAERDRMQQQQQQLEEQQDEPQQQQQQQLEEQQDEPQQQQQQQSDKAQDQSQNKNSDQSNDSKKNKG